MRIDRTEEFLLTAETRQAISALLHRCFPGYPAHQTYYKYPPTFRYLIWEEQELIGHMGVVSRPISHDGDFFSIFGVMDLCISPTHQHQKLATYLLSELENLGKKSGIDFILLVAKDRQLYLNNNFVVVDNSCKWLLLTQNKVLGLVQRQLPGLMIKPLQHHNWPSGTIDLIGPLF
ncbi:MAG: GNAT family N-acetyltransferase [Saprospiraceae bacterium]|nr:GNAT family N-acetyltransferase [Saprospiraceae bacterium]